MRTIEAYPHGPHLSLLTLGALGQVGERGWGLEREKLKQTLDDALASDELRVREFKELDAKRGTRLPAILYAYTIDGALDVIDTACREQGKDRQAVLNGIAEPDDVLALAVQLVGVKIEKQAAESERGERFVGRPASAASDVG